VPGRAAARARKSVTEAAQFRETCELLRCRSAFSTGRQMQPLNGLAAGLGSFAVALAAMSSSDDSRAGSGLLGVDHKIDPHQDTGNWSRGSSAGTPRPHRAHRRRRGALVRVGESPRAHLLAVGRVQCPRRSDRRDHEAAVQPSRPSQTDDPGDWFQGHGHNSFPSGEVMLVTTAVTPFVLEYGPRASGGLCARAFASL
jgi:hypothetical protein